MTACESSLLASRASRSLAGCATRAPAPVRRARAAAARRRRVRSKRPPPEPEKPAPKPVPTHTVKRGETLVGIALQYGLDYRELAAWNNIANLNVISVGQVLVLGAPPARRAMPRRHGPGAPRRSPCPARRSRRARSPTRRQLKVEPRGPEGAVLRERARAALGRCGAGARPCRPRSPAPPPRCRPRPCPRRPAAATRPPGPIARTWTGCGP